jgi:hypothetical protein
MAQDGNGNSWRKWTNHILLTISCALFSGLILLVIWGASSIQKQFSTDTARLEKAIETHSTSTTRAIEMQGLKVDNLCKKVDEHDTLLRIPFDQRKQFYTFPKRMAE